MITGRQIKAARSLAGWDVVELGKRTGLSKDTVHNIESGRTQAREGSLERIFKTFDIAGIEFTDNEGVRIKPNDIETFIGPDRFHDFTEFVYAYLVQHGGDVCISAVNENLFRQYRKDMSLYSKRMQELVDRGDVTVRILATESNFTSNWAQYRWQPAHNTTPTAFYAFGNCLALISFAHEPAPYIVLHKSGPFADAYREAFDTAWSNAKEPPR